MKKFGYVNCFISLEGVFTDLFKFYELWLNGKNFKDIIYSWSLPLTNENIRNIANI